MRLERFYESSLLSEKVSKQEIAEALNNPNIIVGAEFEFIMMSGNQEISFQDEDIAYEYEVAHEEWQDIMDRIEEYQKELVTYHKDTQKLKNKYDTLGLEIDKLNSEWQKAGDNKAKKSKLEASIKIKQKDYAKLEKEIDYRESTGWKKDIDPPPTRGSQTEQYADYIESYMDLNANRELRGTIEGKPPTEPEDMSRSTEAVFEPKAIRKVFDNFKSAPFKHYRIGQYGEVEQKVGSNIWAVEPDGSLGSAGIEIKSPPMPLPEFIKILPKMFDFVNKYGKTTGACGFHVHMSVKGVNNLMGVLDPVKIILFTDEGYIFHLFTDRVNNQYTKSMKDKLKTGSVPSRKELAKGFDLKQAIMMVSSFEHEDAINLQHMEAGHMEFRYMGGANYSKKSKEVISSIGHFAHALAVATDETFKKREYASKLSRIFNKLDLLYSKAILSTINSMRQSYDKKVAEDLRTSSQIKKIEKYHFNQVKNLEKVYKLDRKTMKEIQKNKSYMTDLIEDVKSELQKHVPHFETWSHAVYTTFN